MKSLCVLAAVLLTGCASTTTDEIGTSERSWLRSSKGAVLVGADEAGERVWQFDDASYHFKDGKLTRITRSERQVQISLSPQ